MVKNHKNNRKAFSLVEVLTATIVMTMMLVSVIAYIQYGSLVWQKGQTKIAAKNYSRMAFDLIKQDLMKATLITVPQASSSTEIAATLTYRIPSAGTASVSISLDRNWGKLDRKISGLTTAAISASHTMTIARNVNLFLVERISTWTFRISLQICGIEPTDDINGPSGVADGVINYWDVSGTSDISGPAGIPDGKIDLWDLSGDEIVSSESIVLTAPAAGG